MTVYLTDEEKKELASLNHPALEIIYMNQQKIMSDQIRTLYILRSLNLNIGKFFINTIAPLIWGVFVLICAYFIVQIWGIDECLR